MVKVVATFGNDYSIEQAEKRLLEAGFKFRREKPIKLIIEAKNEKEINLIRQIIVASYGYVEPIESFRARMMEAITKAIKYIIMPKKND
ncbi:MAG: hypothetical protein RXR31_00610 [Thermoproteota archaeon]|jgi:hypothetical protein